MNRRFFLALPFVLFVSMVFAQAPAYQIAVTPYANIGSDRSADYIGFQIAEFLSSAMAGFPGVQVIERTQLMKILEEQELQLSGITEGQSSVNIGQILNARQMVVGSFELTKTRLVVNGRIVDVQSGAVLARATIETPVADSYVEAYKAFMFKLLSELPEYKLTIGVEARIANIKEQASAGTDDYAKALAALYNKDDAAALEYLRKALGTTQVGFVGFGSAADRYVETLSRVRGSSRYAKMVQKQIETNKALMEQVEPLSIYRATLNVLESRAGAILVPGAFSMTGDPAAGVKYDDGLVSTKVFLPNVAGMELKEGARTALASLFSLQDVVKLGKTSLIFAPAPTGKLLGKRIIDRDFNLSIRVSLSHAVQFVNAKGDVLYELISDPAPVVNLSSGSAYFSSSARAVYRTTAYREGWAVHADGSIEIQARALADLDAVRYVIRPESVKFESSFGLGSDLRWRSLITHAYRKYSIKVASEAADPAPQFKDVVIADSFFTTADPELGRVPVLPRNDRVSGFAELTGVVYFADNVKDTITASWRGTVAGESTPFVGELGPNTVLYFDSPSSYATEYGTLEFTARLGQSPSGKTATVSLANGSGWSTGNGVHSYIIKGDLVFTTQGEAYTNKDGIKKWKSDARGYELFIVDSSIVLLHDRGLTYLDIETGTVQHKIEISMGTIYSATLVSGKIYVYCDYGILALDALSGGKLWSAGDGSRSGFVVVFGRVYGSSGSVYDASTGARLFDTEGRGAVAVSGDKAFWANGLCADRETGKPVWKYFDASRRSAWYRDESQGSPIISGDIVYFGTKAAVRMNDGSPLWVAKSGVAQAMLYDGRLYGWDSSLGAYDPDTGDLIWNIGPSLSSTNPRAIQYANGFLYATYSGFGLVKFDVSLFERELSAESMANRARLGFYYATMDRNSGDREGIKITNIISGEAAEKAGFLPGDYIKAFDGRSIASGDHLSDCLFERARGERITVSIERLDTLKNTWTPLSLPLVLGGRDVAPKTAIARPGFSVRTMHREEIWTLKLDGILRQDAAVVLDLVIDGSPAASAGMLAGDILLGLGPVDFLRFSRIYEAYNELTRTLAMAMRSKSPLVFTVLRNGVKKTLPAFIP